MPSLYIENLPTLIQEYKQYTALGDYCISVVHKDGPINLFISVINLMDEMNTCFIIGICTTEHVQVHIQCFTAKNFNP